MNDITPQWMVNQGFSPTFAKRFWKKVAKTESCWIWIACKNKHGYGQINKGERTNRMAFLASRASWMIHFGPIPEGLLVLHNCPGGDNPSCVNPAHLWIGTQVQNMQDASKKGKCKGSQCGDKSNHRKLTQLQVDQMRELCKTRSQYSVAKQFKITATQINRIVHFKSWPKKVFL